MYSGLLWLKAFHIFSMTAWMAGIFYLPRLFVYHAEAQIENDQKGIARFRTMERKLFYVIMTPGAILTLGLGLWLLFGYQAYFLKAGWLHAKLLLVVLLVAYHLLCGHYVKKFQNPNTPLKSSRFFRIFNEVPSVLLMGIVALVVIKPF